MDREKVINGLEHCMEGVVGCQKRCPYKRDFACRSELARDALALLREQEAVEPKRVLGVLPDWYHCGVCGVDMLDTGDGYRPKYCPQCGRAVKWE